MTARRKKPALVISPEQQRQHDEVIREIGELREMLTRDFTKESARFLLVALAEAYPRLQFPRSLKEIERVLAPIYEREAARAKACGYAPEPMPSARAIAKAIGRA